LDGEKENEVDVMDGRVYVVKHVEDEGPGLLGDYFTHLGWEMTVLDAFRGDPLPESLDSAAGVVILGGPMNVYEEKAYPFLLAEEHFIKKVLSEEVPFLGVCLGGQLLAKSCGAAVTKSPHEEKGWFDVELTEAGRRDTLFRGLSDILPIFQWHQDTFDVPEGAVLLATARLCRNQAFRMGNVAYGLQFHPEMTPKMVKSWAEKEPTPDVGSVVEKSEEHWTGFKEQSMIVFENFRHLMESSMRVKRTVRLFVETSRKKPAHLWWSPKERALLGQ
jgi:GMP synthase (glutamine-hydrolysing)